MPPAFFLYSILWRPFLRVKSSITAAGRRVIFLRVCKQQQGARDIWTRIYPTGAPATAGARLCPSGFPMPPTNKVWRRYLRAVRRFWIRTSSLAGGGRRRTQQLSRSFVLQPGESAGGREWVRSTPSRTEEADRPQHLLPAVLATPELMLHPVNRMSWLHESHRADNR